MTDKSDDREANVLAAAASLQSEFKQTIRKYPNSWMWQH
jgi:lauroyl/myristoyl acyltransferase